MNEIGTPSEINLRRMLSLVLHKNLSSNSALCEKAEVLLLNKSNKVPTKKASLEEHSDRLANQDVLMRLIKIKDPTLVIKIGAVTFNVNMEVLENYSDYFRERNESKMLELPAEHVSQTAFAIIYEWMMSDTPNLPRKGVVELYKAAVYLKMPEFLAQFWQCISNPLIIEDKAFLLYLEALAFEAPQVRQIMLGRVSRFFLYIVACEEFFHLPIADLCMLLRSNLIGVNAELEVYFACVRYFNFDWEGRSSKLLEVMNTIRLDFLPTVFALELLNHESCIDTFEVMRLMFHTELQDRLRDLVNYHCLTAFPGPNLVPIQKSNHRHWIFDECCEYHSKQKVRTGVPEYVPYSHFCKYLKLLCKVAPNHWENFQDIQILHDSSSNNVETKWEIMD